MEKLKFNTNVKLTLTPQTTFSELGTLFFAVNKKGKKRF